MSSIVAASPHKPHPILNAWIAISTCIVFWDAGFCLLRPHSMKGGKLFWIWQPYDLYSTVDLVYGHEAFRTGDGFTSAQALLNLVENFINIRYLLLAKERSPSAILVGFTGACFTFWKTVLYWLMDQQCGWCQTGHNSQKDWWILFAVPNGLWIIVPFIVMLIFGSEIAASLRVASAASPAKVKKSL
ncbi:hypothetical protein T439DRAFT_326758 [Meredithblackwellia eburnea MCA 4105]